MTYLAVNILMIIHCTLYFLLQGIYQVQSVPTSFEALGRYGRMSQLLLNNNEPKDCLRILFFKNPKPKYASTTDYAKFFNYIGERCILDHILPPIIYCRNMVSRTGGGRIMIRKRDGLLSRQTSENLTSSDDKNKHLILEIDMENPKTLNHDNATKYGMEKRRDCLKALYKAKLHDTMTKKDIFYHLYRRNKDDKLDSFIRRYTEHVLYGIKLLEGTYSLEMWCIHYHEIVIIPHKIDYGNRRDKSYNCNLLDENITDYSAIMAIIDSDLDSDDITGDIGDDYNLNPRSRLRTKNYLAKIGKQDSTNVSKNIFSSNQDYFDPATHQDIASFPYGMNNFGHIPSSSLQTQHFFNPATHQDITSIPYDMNNYGDIPSSSLQTQHFFDPATHQGITSFPYGMNNFGQIPSSSLQTQHFFKERGNQDYPSGSNNMSHDYNRIQTSHLPTINPTINFFDITNDLLSNNDQYDYENKY